MLKSCVKGGVIIYLKNKVGVVDFANAQTHCARKRIQQKWQIPMKNISKLSFISQYENKLSFLTKYCHFDIYLTD